MVMMIKLGGDAKPSLSCLGIGVVHVQFLYLKVRRPKRKKRGSKRPVGGKQSPQLTALATDAPSELVLPV